MDFFYTKGIMISIIIIIIIIVLGLVIGNFFYDYALNSRYKKKFKNNHKRKGTSSDEKPKNRIFPHSDWLSKVKYTNVDTKSHDYITLKSHIIENPKSNKWVIVAHGYTGSKNEMIYLGENLYNLGYNVLLPDARGHGESEGLYRGMGWKDRHDIIAWINYINHNYKNTEIALHGVSMGGATVMMVSGEDLPSNVKAIIEDCGYSSIYDEFSYELKHLFKLPAFPILYFASLITKIRAGYSLLTDGSCTKQVAKSKTPILFIHGDKDDFVPFYMLDKVYEAANCEKEKLVVEGAGHALSAMTNPKLYWSTIKAFLNNHFSSNSNK